MNILVIGSGGREHALVKKLKEGSGVEKIFCAPGNAGIAQDAEIVSIAAGDFAALIDFAKKNSIGLTVVGPEDPLAAGIVDAFEEAGLKIFGPCKAGARLEADKTFAKEIMLLNNVPTGYAEEFSDSKAALRYLESQSAPYVIKATGLCAGKGVTVTSDLKAAEAAVKAALDKKVFGEAGAKVLIEEYLDGEEASILAFTDGETIQALLPSQDHKRLNNNDEGPNTGGMGAYAPANLITPEIMEEIYQTILYPTLRGLKKKGISFKGILYAGLMITDKGPKVIEYNVRFGDPETQAVLPLLKTDLAKIMLACIDGKLNEIQLENKNAYSCCIIAASGGYPDKYEKGKEVFGLEKETENTIVFHSGTSLENGKTVTNGGRVLGVTSIASDLKSAKEQSLEHLKNIRFDKMHYRTDIADRQLTRKSVSIIMGSDSDLEVMSECVKTLESFGIGCEVNIGSAHRTPEKVKLYAKNLKRNGIRVVICAAGLSAHLAGVVASLTDLPVIGVPMSGGSLGGLDALLSTVNMPGGVPVATVSIGKAGAKNAAILAARIIALFDKEVAEKLRRFITNMADEIESKDKALKEKNK